MRRQNDHELTAISGCGIGVRRNVSSIVRHQPPLAAIKIAGFGGSRSRCPHEFNPLLRKESLVFIVSADPEPEEDVLLKKGERAVAVADSN